MVKYHISILYANINFILLYCKFYVTKYLNVYSVKGREGMKRKNYLTNFTSYSYKACNLDT